MNNMKGCILDQGSFDRNDVVLSPLTGLIKHWDFYQSSTADEVAMKISGCDIVITNKAPIPRAVIEQSPQLKLVMLAATGTDNVDLDACKERGIIVCNARRYANAAVVQHVFTLMLCLMTNIMGYQRDVAAGRWSGNDVFCLLEHPIRELEGKTLGIIGYGNLGAAVARVGEAFGMAVAVCQRPATIADPGSNSDRLPLPQFLETADIISIHCPLTQDTRHLLSTDQFRQMKSDAVVINTARGAIIDDHALVAALRSGEISGAGIDVLDKEPPPPGHPLLEKGIPNLILTPHNAWGSKESRQRLVNQMAENLSGWLAGVPKNSVT